MASHKNVISLCRRFPIDTHYIIVNTLDSSYEIKDFVETHLCTLCDTPMNRVLGYLLIGMANCVGLCLGTSVMYDVYDCIESTEMVE